MASPSRAALESLTKLRHQAPVAPPSPRRRERVSKHPGGWQNDAARGRDRNRLFAVLDDMSHLSPSPIRLAVSADLVAYPDALAVMAHQADLIGEGRASELIWFLEHPALLTRGSRARTEHLRDRFRFPVFDTDRGGEITYHGPGQRIVYVMLDVRRRTNGDIRAFVRLLETTVIGALDSLGVAAHSDPARPGVWVARRGLPGGAAKIAALGLKVRRGISRHGFSLNIAPDLSHYAAFVACGIEDRGVTSLAALGAATDRETVDNALIASLTEHLGALVRVPEPAAASA